MESITRRLFLRNSATASAFSFVGLSPVLASSIEPDENPLLLAMAPRCAELEAACIMTDAERLAARERYELLKPKTPKDIVFAYNERIPDAFRYCTETERDGEYEVSRLGDQPPRNIVSSHQISLRTPAVKSSPSTDDPTQLVFLRQMYRTALRYERGCEKAREASGLNGVAEVMYGLYADVSRYARTVCEQEARTWAGIAIKARACELVQKWSYDNGRLSSGHLSVIYVVPNIITLSKGGAA